MSKNLHVLGGSVLGALALMAVSVMPASAASTDTDFVLAAGERTLAVQPTANLDANLADQATAGDAEVEGSLGAVTVTDETGGTTGWSVEVSSTAFTRDAADAESVSSAVAYNAGTVTKGLADDVTFDTITQPTNITQDADELTPDGIAVVSTNIADGTHSATWEPTLTVDLPRDALAGAYSGVVTTSVL